MKKIIFILLLGLLFTGCAVNNYQSSMVGRFKGEGSDIINKKSLSLNEDMTFYLNYKGTDYSGKWEYQGNGLILLKFNELDDPLLYLAWGTITDREKTIKIISRNKIRLFYGYVIKRVQ